MRNLYLKLFSLIILSVLCSTVANATHYLGGEMSYTYLGNNNYRITVRLYHDCHHGDSKANEQDLPVIYSVFAGNGSRYLSDSMGGVFKSLPITPLPGCYHDANTYCAEYAELQKTVTLPPSTSGYILVNQRCCMGTDVENISSSGSEGLTLSCNIPGTNAVGADNNASAVFKTLPPVRVCRNTDVSIDFGATDPDGDSLAYRLATAYRGGAANNAKPTPTSAVFSPLPYAAGFSPTEPFGAAGDLVIDPASGIATGSCSLEGDFVLSVACDEYRSGTLISTVTRTYVLQVADCNKEVNAAIQKDSVLVQSGTGGISINRCGGLRTISFINKSSGALAYHWDFGVSGRDDDTSDLPNPQFTYPADGRYPLTLIAYGAHCSDTLRTFVLLSDDAVTPDFSISGRPCLLDTITLTDNSTVTGSAITQSIWHMSGGIYTGNPVAVVLGQAGVQTIAHTVITAGGCIAAVSKPYTIRQGTIYAGADTTVTQGAVLILQASGGSYYNWTAYSPGYFPNYLPGASYQQVGTTMTGRNFVYIVTGKDAQGCGGSDTVHVNVSERGYAFVPSAFSPNGDGRNDLLKAQLSGYNFVSFSVFNSRGNRVFYSEDLHGGWDGRYKNEEATTEVFFWMIMANDPSGKRTVFKGDVTLVR